MADPFVHQDASGEHGDLADNIFLTNLLSTLPQLDAHQSKCGRNGMATNGNGMNGNSLFSNISDSLNNDREARRVYNSFGNYNMDSSNPIDIFGNSGIQRIRRISPTTSNNTNSSSGSPHSIDCVNCEQNAVNRCLDCSVVFCSSCVQNHEMSAYTKSHTIVGLGKITPIGSISSASMLHSVNMHASFEPKCEIHGEALRFICETCKIIVCQECTLKDHKDHHQTLITQITTENAKEKLRAIHQSSKLGIKFIKTSIDRAVAISHSIERDSSEISSRVKKGFRALIHAAEDRERTVLEQVDRYRQQKVSNLTDQMTQLRSALAGLAETSEYLAKSVDSVSDNTSKIDIAFLLANTENKIEKFASMYKNLQPKEETLTFLPPNYVLIQEIQNQGEILVTNKNNLNFQNSSNGGANGSHSVAASASSMLTRRPSRASNSPNNGDQLLWESKNQAGPSGNGNGSSHVTSEKTYAAIVRPAVATARICIPGSNVHVGVKPAATPKYSFCTDGPEDGEVSRPWGICVNKSNDIIIADRRNNRVQVFSADGTFKFKFGSKGTANGQFDLPAGVATDQNNRIIVVDKDNHRVQVFSHNGVFILKFGSYGKELSQFMYPWACAVNSKAQILVTDSRNHRIQLFSSDGHFISRLAFDGMHHTRYLKGMTTPRGVAFNPKGEIIVSDFENHRLILIDPTMTKIIESRGTEGSGLRDFCRPSGICCDDDGRIIVADSKNQRVIICAPNLDFLWNVEIRPSAFHVLIPNMEEKDRPSDVALLNDGRLVVLVETSPDSREVISPHKTFVQVY